MPELPEVETTRLSLLPRVKGKIITAVKIREPRLRWPIPLSISQQLKHQRIVELKRRAKYLIFELEQGSLIWHLGMSGHLKFTSLEAPWEKHEHFGIQLNQEAWLKLHDPRRFGSIHYTKQPWQDFRLLQALGIEPLSNAFTAEYLFAQSRNKSSACKIFIMNQAIVVGVGNIYANEALFAAQISPFKIASDLSKAECKKLCDNIKKILTKAIEAGGTTLRDFLHQDGKTGYFSHHLQVYGKQGEDCERCASPIARIMFRQRATYFCPNCQD